MKMNEAFSGDELGPALRESIDNAPDLPETDDELEVAEDDELLEGEGDELEGYEPERPAWVNAAAVVLGLLTVGAVAYKVMPRGKATAPPTNSPKSVPDITSLDAYNQFINDNPGYL